MLFWTERPGTGSKLPSPGHAVPAKLKGWPWGEPFLPRLQQCWVTLSTQPEKEQLKPAPRPPRFRRVCLWGTCRYLWRRKQCPAQPLRKLHPRWTWVGGRSWWWCWAEPLLPSAPAFARKSCGVGQKKPTSRIGWDLRLRRLKWYYKPYGREHCEIPHALCCVLESNTFYCYYCYHYYYYFWDRVSWIPGWPQIH